MTRRTWHLVSGDLGEAGKRREACEHTRTVPGKNYYHPERIDAALTALANPLAELLARCVS